MAYSRKGDKNEAFVTGCTIKGLGFFPNCASIPDVGVDPTSWDDSGFGKDPCLGDGFGNCLGTRWVFSVDARGAPAAFTRSFSGFGIGEDLGNTSGVLFGCGATGIGRACVDAAKAGFPSCSCVPPSFKRRDLCSTPRFLAFASALRRTKLSWYRFNPCITSGEHTVSSTCTWRGADVVSVLLGEPRRTRRRCQIRWRRQCFCGSLHS